jgi:hypothetical protein
MVPDVNDQQRKVLYRIPGTPAFGVSHVELAGQHQSMDRFVRRGLPEGGGPTEAYFSSTRSSLTPFDTYERQLPIDGNDPAVQEVRKLIDILVT